MVSEPQLAEQGAARAEQGDIGRSMSWFPARLDKHLKTDALQTSFKIETCPFVDTSQILEEGLHKFRCYRIRIRHLAK